MTTESGIGAEAPASASERNSATSALDWAVFGCLVAGGVGIFKALGMESASGVLLCLLGSVAAFGMVFYMHVRKS